jgi:hypothetical protein
MKTEAVSLAWKNNYYNFFGTFRIQIRIEKKFKLQEKFSTLKIPAG